MKILAIGDPHGNIPRILPKDVDLILLTGDIGKADLARKMAFENIERKKQGLPEVEYSAIQKKRAFMEEYNSCISVVRHLSKIAPVYTIYGNVEKNNYEVRRIMNEIRIKLPFFTNALNSIKNTRVINNKVANFNGLRIGGLEYFVDTNWVRDFKPSEYRESLKDAKEMTDKARNILDWFGEVDILVCHQPPYGILDKVSFKSAPKHWMGKHAGSETILKYIK